jgi:hypothetical protein
MHICGVTWQYSVPTGNDVSCIDQHKLSSPTNEKGKSATPRNTKQFVAAVWNFEDFRRYFLKKLLAIGTCLEIREDFEILSLVFRCGGDQS